MGVKIRTIAVAIAAVAVCLVAVSGAAARVIPTLTTALTQTLVVPTGITGATTLVTQTDAALGAHADFDVNINFSEGATQTTGSGLFQSEVPSSYPAGSNLRETVKDLVVDIPDGLVGNPNAIPYDERCDVSTFETSYCPDSATVGQLQIKISLPSAADSGGALSITPFSLPKPGDLDKPSAGWTRVSLLKTDPEVPAKIGVFVHSPLDFSATRTTLQIAPKTDDGLRLRTINIDDLPNTVINGNYDPAEQGYVQPLRIDWMKLKFYGKLANGHNFMTNPTKCAPWVSQVWANATYVNDNLDSFPLGPGTDGFKSDEPKTITPDCSNAGSIPFPISGNVAINTPDRDTAPSFDFTIANPGIYGDGQVSSTPQKIVTTIPASINVDVQQLGRTCPVTNFYANTCPATSKVGSVAIETPLIKKGLTGNVYLVKKNASSGLPDLGLYVTGAITFTQLGSNRYVGAKFNQIETTFDSIPQVGFSKLTFHLDGGPNGLLRSLACPTYNKAPALPTFTYNFYAYTGAYKQSTTPLNLANCFGIQTLKKYPKCLIKKLPIHPNYQSRVRVKSVTAKIDGKTKASTKKAPFRFDLKIKKLKLKQKKTHKLELKATYDDGTISKKQVNFKVCKK
jgi:hypothetical protein